MQDTGIIDTHANFDLALEHLCGLTDCGSSAHLFIYPYEEQVIPQVRSVAREPDSVAG